MLSDASIAADTMPAQVRHTLLLSQKPFKPTQHRLHITRLQMPQLTSSRCLQAHRDATSHASSTGAVGCDLAALRWRQRAKAEEGAAAAAAENRLCCRVDLGGPVRKQSPSGKLEITYSVLVVFEEEAGTKGAGSQVTTSLRCH